MRLLSKMYLKTLKQVIGKRGLLGVVLTALLYIALVSYLLNYRLFLNTVFGSFSFDYKIRLLVSLLPGIYTAFSTLDFYLILITSGLVGLNFVLLFLTIKEIRKSLDIGLVVGGSGLISLAAAGCTSCGLTLLSLLGISSVLGTLPFGGLTLHLVSIFLLTFSILYMLKNLQAVCKIPRSNV